MRLEYQSEENVQKLENEPMNKRWEEALRRRVGQVSFEGSESMSSDH